MWGRVEFNFLSELKERKKSSSYVIHKHSVYGTTLPTLVLYEDFENKNKWQRKKGISLKSYFCQYLDDPVHIYYVCGRKRDENKKLFCIMRRKTLDWL